MSIDFNSLQEYKTRHNIDELVRRPNGLSTRQLRQRIWPKLLGIDRYYSADQHYARCISVAPPGQIYVRQVPHGLISFTADDVKSLLPCDTLLSAHRDSRTIHNDISRSLWVLSSIESDAMDLDLCLPVVKWDNDVYMYRNRLVLTNIILLILTKHTHLYYYQGYHDILSVILIAMQDPLLSYSVSEALTCRFLGDMMQKEFSTITLTLPLVLTVIKEADVELYEVLVKVLCLPGPESELDGNDKEGEEESKSEEQLSQAVMFTLCNYITWFAHDIKKMSQICWIFDVFLSMPPDYSVYFTAALIISFKDEIIALSLSPDEDEIKDEDDKELKWRGEKDCCKDGFGRAINSGSGCDYATMYTFLLNLTRPPKKTSRDDDDDDGDGNGEANVDGGDSPSTVGTRGIDIRNIIEISDTLYQHIYPPSVLLSRVLHPPAGATHAHNKCRELIRSGTITIFNYLYDKKNSIGCTTGTIPVFKPDSFLLMRAWNLRQQSTHLQLCHNDNDAVAVNAKVVNDAVVIDVSDGKCTDGADPMLSAAIVVSGEVLSDEPSPTSLVSYLPLLVTTALHGLALYCILFTDSPAVK